jgi:hypothetical protein
VLRGTHSAEHVVCMEKLGRCGYAVAMKGSVRVPALIGLTILVSSASVAAAQPDQLIGVEVHSFAELEHLHEMGLDVLTERARPGWVDVRVPGHTRALVSASGLETEVIVDDLSSIPRPTPDDTAPFFDDFREFTAIEGHLAQLAVDHPDQVETFEIGRSVEDRPITAVRVGSAPEDAPTLLVTSGQHAREWVAVSSGVCIADSLATRASEPELGALLEEVRFVVVPVVNPDGYVYSWEQDRFWRKNRRDGFGVDLNRNYGIGFGGPGSSADPSRGNYRGSAAFSEPESAAIRDLAEEIEDVRAHLDVHSFGQLVLRPWGHVDTEPPAQDVLLPLSETIAASMSQSLGEAYVPLSGTDLYPAAGNAQDWAYGALGAMSFTLELRPSEVEQIELGFVLHPDLIDDVCLESMAAVLELAAWTAASEPGQPGTTGESPDPAGTTTDDGTGTTGASVPDTSTGSTSAGSDPTLGESTTRMLSGDGPGSSSDDSSAAVSNAADQGCACGATRLPDRIGGFFALLLAAGRRRRRSSARGSG